MKRLLPIGLALVSLLLLGQARPPRSPNIISTDLNDTEAKLPDMWKMLHKDKNADAAATAIPILKKANQLIDELVKADPSVAPRQQYHAIHNLVLLAILGDDESAKRLDTLAKSSAPSTAHYGKVARLVRDWWTNAGDANAQKKILDNAKSLAKANPKDDFLTFALIDMHEHGAAVPDLATAVEDIIYSDLQSDAALRYKAAPHVGRALAFSGPILGPNMTFNSTFKSAAWKGKVILVHIWRYDNKVSRDQLALLKKILDGAKDKNFEIVGVSCEHNVTDMITYLKEHQITWPQLVDPNSLGWNPLVGQWQTSVSQCFIIDRAGIVRAKEPPFEKLDEILAPILDEKAPPPATPAKK